MRIHVLSDLHLEFREFAMPDVGADVRVLAGDIHVKNRGMPFASKCAKDMPTIYIAGNHEFYGSSIPKLYDQLQTEAAGLGVHFLQNAQVMIGSVRFLGCTLWTDFELLGNDSREVAMLEAGTEMNDYRKIRVDPKYHKLTPLFTRGFHHRSMAWLEENLRTPFEGKTVVVTHHAPSKSSLASEDLLSASFASNLDDFIRTWKIDLWIHGHTHRCVDYRIGGTRVVCNPRGYPGEETLGFDPGHVITV